MEIKLRQVLVVLVVGIVSAQPLAAEGLVKQSSSGLCHPPESPWYDRTENYKAYDSVEACLEGGGRLPKGLTMESTVQRGTSDDESREYTRAKFGHGWDDYDGDCQNSRAEALIATSTTKARFASADRCRVATGRWISPYTGKVILKARDIDIDHVVPLAWAWDHGARIWANAKREQFANDPVNLLPVEASLNRSKGASGPDQWLPPVGRCAYVARFTRIVKQYQLKPTKPEANWLHSFLDGCR